MDIISYEPFVAPVPSKAETQSTEGQRHHDGWTGEKMAIFCEALAETAILPVSANFANIGEHKAYDLCDLSQFRWWR